MSTHADVAELMSVTELRRFVIESQLSLSGCQAVVGQLVDRRANVYIRRRHTVHYRPQSVIRRLAVHFGAL